MPSLSHDYQFALDIQKSIGAIGAKLDRVIDDVAKQGEKLDDLRHKVSFVRGTIFVLGALVAVVGYLVANNITVSFGTMLGKQGAPTHHVEHPK